MTHLHERSIRPGGLAAAAAAFLAAASALASSHREAPFITELPKVDGTDFYMFNSYEPGREGFVTIVANYLPLQDPYGGPNYFQLDPDALYQIHIDNNGDAQEDITFEFRFTSTLRGLSLNIGGMMVPVPLIQIGQIGPTAGDNANLNIVETFTASVVLGDRYTGQAIPISNAGNGATTFLKPVDNIGPKTIPDYAAYANDHIYSVNFNIPGCDTPGRMFVGQRKDPFVVALGKTFDLVNLNPLGPPDGKADDLADKNVTSLILEVPASCLTAGNDPVIGGWTTASLRRARVLTTNPSFPRPASEQGSWIQVSRLGMPLVNEVVIGLPDKNLFNAAEPTQDGALAGYVTNPTLPALLEVLFPGVAVAPCLPRNDLVAAFLTGVKGLNQPVNVTASEMLRLNTSTPVTPAPMQSNLGVLGGDLAGFPNGRRPGDDVVDIALRVVMGALIADANCAPNNTAPLTDGALVNAGFFDTTFPYVRTPIPGGQ